MQLKIALKLPMHLPVVGRDWEVSLLPRQVQRQHSSLQQKGQERRFSKLEGMGHASLLKRCTSSRKRSHGTRRARNKCNDQRPEPRKGALDFAAAAAPRPTRGAAFFLWDASALRLAVVRRMATNAIVRHLEHRHVSCVRLGVLSRKGTSPAVGLLRSRKWSRFASAVREPRAFPA